MSGTVGATTGANSVDEKLRNATAEANINFAVTSNGWLTEESFLVLARDYFPAPGRDVLFIMDHFAAHRTVKVMEFLKLRGVTLFFIPARCTGILQYHDVNVNK